MGISDLFHKKEQLPQKTEAELRLHRCTFTGHRPERIRGMEAEIITGLRKEILAAIEGGYTTLITACSRGVDLWAASIVLDLRRGNKALRLICAVPFEGFESRWPVDRKKHYNLVRKQADHVQILSDRYSSDVYQKRNQCLVNHSSRLIAVFNGEPSGTGNTIQYAQEQGIPVEIIVV